MTIKQTTVVTPKLVPELPYEIFGFVAKLLASDRFYETLASLTSTSRRMYELLLPTLYRTLVLTPRSISFLEDLAREAWVNDRIASLWFHPTNIGWQNTGLPRHFTSVKRRAGMVQTVVIDHGVLGIDALHIAAFESPDQPEVEFPCKLPRLLPRATSIIVTRELVDEMVVLESKVSRMLDGEDPTCFAYHRKLAYLCDCILAFVSPSPHTCVHVSSLEYLAGTILYDYNYADSLAWCINNVITSYSRHFSRPGSSPILQFCNLPVVPIMTRAGKDVQVSFRRAERHLRLLWTALEYMLSGEYADDGRIIMYGGPPSEEVGETDDSRVLDDDEFPPLPSPLAESLAAYFRGESKAAGRKSLGYRMPTRSGILVPWQRVDDVLRNRLVCRPLPREEIEGVCVFCGTDW